MDLGKVELPEHDRHSLRMWAAVGAIAWCAVYGWFSFVRGTDVPILFLLQLATHEVGHLAFRPFGEFTMLVMGSGTEILVPLLLGIGYLAWKRNLVAASVCLAWASAACAHTAAYIADAVRGEMILIGSDEGDWERILGVEFWDDLPMADVYAGRVRAVGLVVWFVALAVAIAAVWFHAKRSKPPAPERPRLTFAKVSPEDQWR